MKDDYKYYTYYTDHNDRYWDYYRPREIDIKTTLAPLINQMKLVDDIRTMLEQKGGRISDLKRMTDLLKEQFSIDVQYNNKHKVSLIDHEALNRVIKDVSYDLHIQIRRLPKNGLPVFYIARTKHDYWSEYNLVLEDIYKSDGYIIPDERFVKFMYYTGHEVYYLRMSQFYAKTRELVSKNNLGDIYRTTDHILCNASIVLNSAWHDDQRIALLCGKLFGMKNFVNAVELLYLALNSDLCEIRSEIDKESVKIFFESIYEQPAIWMFINLLSLTDGETLGIIPKHAQACYTSLLKSFNKFLVNEVTYGSYRMRSPIYKIILGNLSRLETVKQMLGENGDIKNSIQVLDRESESIIEEIIYGFDRNLKKIQRIDNKMA